jgi:hypothetical protein
MADMSRPRAALSNPCGKLVFTRRFAIEESPPQADLWRNNRIVYDSRAVRKFSSLFHTRFRELRVRDVWSACSTFELWRCRHVRAAQHPTVSKCNANTPALSPRHYYLASFVTRFLKSPRTSQSVKSDVSTRAVQP